MGTQTLVYNTIGTAKKHSESEQDHSRMEKMLREEWENIRNFPRLPKEDIKEWQFKRIVELVTHAFNTVPLYHSKYSNAGFHPMDLKSWKDFESLPILYKEEIIDAFPDRFVSKNHSLEFTTRSSGSSGKFVTIAVSPEALYRDTFQGARQFELQGGSPIKPEDETLFIYTDPWWFSSINGKYKSHFLPTTTKIEDAIDTIKEIRPRFLSLYPTYLEKIASYNIDLSKHGVELIVVHSEQSSKKQRGELSDILNVPVRDEFSSEELTRIALECPKGKYHLEEDACYIEILDPKDKSQMEIGKSGIVVGTNLLNEATPIIRYFQGDIATLSEEKNCDCNSNYRILSEPHGRVMDSIILPDDNYVPASCFLDLAYNWFLDFEIPIHGLRYQIIQEDNHSTDVYIIKGAYEINKEHIEKIRESMYSLLPREMDIRVKLSEKPPIDNGQKYRPVISKANGGIKND